MDKQDSSEPQKPEQSEWFERVREHKKLTSEHPQKRSKKRLFYPLAILVIASAVLVAFFMTREPDAQQPASQSPAPVAQSLPPPPPPSTPQRDVELEKIFNDWANSHPNNDWAMSVIGLDSDTRFAKFNDDEVFASASIYKLLLMYPLFQRYTLNEARGATLNVFGASKNLLECVSLMLKVSDNPCGHAVGNLVGWAKADNELQKLGLATTKLNSAAGSLTSAGDTALFLKALYNDRLFDKETKQYIFDTLYQQTWQDGIPAGCPDCRVANKTGDLGVRHDAAIVEYDGGAYVLVIFSDGASYAQIAQLTSRVHEHMSSAN